MADTKYYRVPFAETGDTSPVPDAAPGDGSISYEAGFGPDYQKNLENDPNAKAVPRTPFNEVLKDITTNIQQYQQWGTPNFITSADNGGSPFSYSKNARVLFDDGAGGGIQVFESKEDANTTTPATDPTKWGAVNENDLIWDASRDYKVNDFVSYQTALYRSIQSPNINRVPSSENAFWQLYGLLIEWKPNIQYYDQQIVSYEGNIYRAVGDSINQAPDPGGPWTIYGPNNIVISTNSGVVTSMDVISLADSNSGTLALSATIQPSRSSPTFLIEFSSSLVNMTGAVTDGVGIMLVHRTGNTILNTKTIPVSHVLATDGWSLTQNDTIAVAGDSPQEFEVRFGLINSVGGQANLAGDSSGFICLKVTEIFSD